jgi:transposase InsO family protein
VQAVHLATDGARRGKVLDAVGIPRSSWYHRPVDQAKRRPKGPAPDPIPDWMESVICFFAELYPMWGYKRIATLCRRNGHPVSNKKAYRVFKQHGLLCRPKPRDPAVYQAAKLFDLLPQRPNDLWQTDVTYIHIPGHGWWYAVTVIDYYSRYLLACHLTHSYSAAECTKAIDLARQHAEAIHGPLKRTPFLVTDNGSSFMAHAFRDHIAEAFCHVRIQYRTPTQLGLLERFHQTLKAEEVYYRIYRNPGECRDCLEAYRDVYNKVRPHWALRPEEGGDPVPPAGVYCHGMTIGIPRWQHWARAAKKKLDEMLGKGQDAA